MFHVFKKLGWFFKHYWKRYLFAVIALMTASAVGLIPPKIIGTAIDHIRFETLTMKILTTLILTYALVMFLHYTIGFLWDFTLFGGAVILERWIRSRLIAHFMKMSPPFYGSFRTGDLMARSTNDLKAIMMTAGFGILTLVDSSTFMLMIIAVMGFTISWKLAFAALIPLPIMAILMNKYGSIIHERFMAAQDAFGDLNNQVLESMRGIRVLRAFVQEKQDEKRFNEMAKEVYDKNIAVAKIDALFDPTMKILVGIAYTIGLGYGALLVIQNQITLGDLVSFNVYLGMLIWPMFAVGELINIMQRGNASLDRVNEVLNYSPDIVDAKHPVKISDVQQIQFQDVTFTYPNTKRPQLSNINLTIHKGETIGVVGRTGGGKTTLFKVLLRQYPNVQGKITINGYPLEDIRLAQLRDFIGYVPQDQILFTKTIRENIQFGKKNATDKEIYRVMELAHF